jgi:hypothetical protein
MSANNEQQPENVPDDANEHCPVCFLFAPKCV